MTKHHYFESVKYAELAKAVASTGLDDRPGFLTADQCIALAQVHAALFAAEAERERWQ